MTRLALVSEDEPDLMITAIRQPMHLKCDKCDDLWFVVIEEKYVIYHHRQYVMLFTYGTWRKNVTRSLTQIKAALDWHHDREFEDD